MYCLIISCNSGFKWSNNKNSYPDLNIFCQLEKEPTETWRHEEEVSSFKTVSMIGTEINMYSVGMDLLGPLT